MDFIKWLQWVDAARYPQFTDSLGRVGLGSRQARYPFTFQRPEPSAHTTGTFNDVVTYVVPWSPGLQAASSVAPSHATTEQELDHVPPA